eukprot:1452255-Amphidinium_carterae.1
MGNGRFGTKFLYFTCFSSSLAFASSPCTILPESGRVRPTVGLTISVPGTSMACPMVAGAVSLLWDKYPTASAQLIKKVILASGDKVQRLGTYKEAKG